MDGIGDGSWRRGRELDDRSYACVARRRRAVLSRGGRLCGSDVTATGGTEYNRGAAAGGGASTRGQWAGFRAGPTRAGTGPSSAITVSAIRIVSANGHSVTVGPGCRPRAESAGFRQ